MGNLFTTSNDVNISVFSSNSELSLPEVGVLPTAKLLREEAHQLQHKAIEASKQSQWQYQFGSRSEAKRLSDQKKALYNEMNQKKRRAAELIFRYHNDGRPEDEIDLHSLYVAEALEYLQRKIDECRIKNISRLEVITGMGNHSQDRIAKIKPKVEEFARQNHLDITPHLGYVVLNLTQNRQPQLPARQTNDECIIL